MHPPARYRNSLGGFLDEICDEEQAGEPMYYNLHTFQHMVISLIPREFKGEPYPAISGGTLCTVLVEVEDVFLRLGATNFTSKVVIDNRRVATLTLAFFS